jgi:histidinol dehydrogenase
MIEVTRLASLDADALDRLTRRGRAGDPAVRQAVAGLLSDVRRDGDAALREQTTLFDGVELDAIEVDRAIWRDSLESLDPELRSALESAGAAIRRFHASQRPLPLERELAPGLTLGRRPDPLRRVGVYAPGGRAAYPSSVLMGVVPARVAGVDEVVVCSPPGPDGLPSPLVMAACAVAGADHLFAVGGTAAIGAMAYGTRSVPSCDRIVGPGNAYVMEAKLQVASVTGIDSPAGPSELLIIADRTADAETVAVELIAQAEHDPDAAVVLVTTDEDVARDTASALERLVPDTPRREIVEAALAGAGALLVADGLADAASFAERYAPEHLLLLVDEPRRALASVRAAGTVFLGPRSSVAFGDYATGANHVLPTGGLARSYSGLSVDDFVRWTTWQEVATDEAAATLARVAGPLADAEGLPGHAAAARRAAGRGGSGATGDERPEGQAERTGPGEPTRALDPAAAGRTPPVLPRAPYREIDAYDPKRTSVEVDLSANTNLWGTCPAALSALEDAGDPVSYPAVYADGLKAAIAEAWSLEPDQVTTGCGSDDLIDSTLRAFCEPGAVVGFPAPTFPMTEVFARMNDARPLPVPMGPDGGLDDDAVATLLDTDAVYLCRPNNPTGAMIPEPRVREILERARGLVLLDEAYGEYAGASLLEPAMESGRAVVFRTFSKAYGLAGLRTGYVLGPAPLIRAVELSRGPYKVNALAERAASAAIRDGRAWVEGIVAETVANRGRLADELRRRGFRVYGSAANFLLVGAPEGDAARLKAELGRRGIGVRAFDALDGVGDAIRVTVGPWAIMERFLAALDAALAGRGLDVDPRDAEAIR